MNRKILVTGANGFIGSRVLTALIDQGDIPIALVRSSSNLWRINSILSKITMYNIDCVPLDQIFNQEKIDAIINLSTYYKKHNSYEDIDKIIDANINFPAKILELCKKHEVPLFITAGTYFQYDQSDSTINEEHSSAARDLYGAAKNALEKIMEYYSSNSKTKTVSLVLFTPYGEMDHEEKLIPYVVKLTMKRKPLNLNYGFQKLNLVYIQDVVDGFIRSLDLISRDIPPHIRINLANKRSYSIREIVTVVEELLKYHVDVNWNSLNLSKIDLDDELVIETSFAEEIIGWKPQFDIYEGFKRTIEYYKGEENEA